MPGSIPGRPTIYSLQSTVNLFTKNQKPQSAGFFGRGKVGNMMAEHLSKPFSLCEIVDPDYLIISRFL